MLVRVVSALGVLLFVLSASWLSQIDQGGFAHEDGWLPDGTPITVYLPRPADDATAFQIPVSPDRRAPVVVLMHGFASDRNTISGLVRRLVVAGYAVVALDAPGHGANRNPYHRGRVDPGSFAEVFGAAVDFARGYPFVDGLRVAVGGHSMGASAALDYASRDAGVDATLLVSGGRSRTGPYRPSNPLFLLASGDPERIRGAVGSIAARIAEDRMLGAGRTVGDHAKRTAVRRQLIDGTGHTDVVNARETGREAIEWLDASFGIEREGSASIDDPRLLPWLLSVVAFLLCLPGLGALAARRVRVREVAPDRGPLALPLLAAGLLLAMPAIASGAPFGFLAIEVADLVASHFALAGIALLAVLATTGRFDVSLERGDLVGSLAAGLLVVAALFTLLQPVGTFVNGFDFTPERALLFVLLALSFLPFSLAFELLLRRGPPRTAALRCLLGRLIVVGVLWLGLFLGLLPSVVGLMLGALVALFALVEIIAATLYAYARDPFSVALVDAATLALVLSLTMPVRL